MGKKILLADDSITIQKVIELTFSDEDFDVVTVSNGRLALERLPDVRPDIVLCDIIMPEKDGYEVCEQIKANPSFAHIPVLLLTGAFEPFDQERAARAGYDGSLAKPFEPETLIAKVKDLLARAPVRTVSLPPGAARPAPPAAAAPSPVLPFQRPSPPSFAAPPPAAPSFVPEEPFGTFDESAFAEEAAGAEDTFAPMTEEESATLLAPPAAEPPSADAASTVMFRADELPWNAPAAAPAPEAPRAAAPPAVSSATSPALPPAAPEPAPVTAPTPAVVAPPEPVFVPEEVEAPEVVEEAVFEEVLAEDLDFGTGPFEPEAATAEQAEAVTFLPEESTLAPTPPGEGGVTGAFAALTMDEPVLPPVEPVFEPQAVEDVTAQEAPVEPAATFAEEQEAPPEPVAAAPEVEPAFEPEPAPAPPPEVVPEIEPEPEPEPVPSPVPAPVVTEPPPAPAEPALPRAPLPPTAPPPAPESFADVAVAVAEPAPVPAPPSEAAAVSVPVEMVEKIAQRVVAQISEKAVREIAWEVIPDLAEALIKQEIERLKAELQKT